MASFSCLICDNEISKNDTVRILTCTNSQCPGTEREYHSSCVKSFTRRLNKQKGRGRKDQMANYKCPAVGSGNRCGGTIRSTREVGHPITYMNDSTYMMNDNTMMNDSTYMMNDSTFMMNDSTYMKNDSTYMKNSCQTTAISATAPTNSLKNQGQSHKSHSGHSDKTNSVIKAERPEQHALQANSNDKMIPLRRSSYEEDHLSIRPAAPESLPEFVDVRQGHVRHGVVRHQRDDITKRAKPAIREKYRVGFTAGHHR